MDDSRTLDHEPHRNPNGSFQFDNQSHQHLLDEKVC